MKYINKIIKNVSFLILLFMFIYICPVNLHAESNKTEIEYSTHIQDIGWQGDKSNGQMSGTSGQSKRLEGIKIRLKSQEYEGAVIYSTHIQDIGWQGDKSNGQMSGTSGQSKRLEAIRISLSGEIAEHYDIYYRVHAQNFGWLGWAKNGEKAGSSGYSYRLEAIEIKLVKKSESAPGTSYKSYASAIKYKTHVQDYGWENAWKIDNQTSGTVGAGKRLEGIQIMNSDDTGVEYRTHIQDVGWESTWKNDGQMSGTSGQSKRLEAIQIRLTGELAKHYDIYYKVHVQNIGWMNWVKNGEIAGTEGKALRLEGIVIKLVEKSTTYNVTFDTEGGTYVESQKVLINNYVRKPANPTKQGYVFDGWEYEGNEYDFYETTVNNDMTLKAKWLKLPDTPNINAYYRDKQDISNSVEYAICDDKDRYCLDRASSEYEVWYKTSENDNWKIMLSSNWISVPTGEKYYIKLRDKNYIYDKYSGEYIYGDFSNIVEVTGIKKPIITYSSAGVPRLSGSFSENYASGVEVYRKLDSGEYELIEDINSNENDAIDMYLEAVRGAYNYYKVRYYNYRDDKKIYSEFATAQYNLTYKNRAIIDEINFQNINLYLKVSNGSTTYTYNESFDGIEVYYSKEADDGYKLLGTAENDNDTSAFFQKNIDFNKNEISYVKARYYSLYNGKKFYSEFSEPVFVGTPKLQEIKSVNFIFDIPKAGDPISNLPDTKEFEPIEVCNSNMDCGAGVMWTDENGNDIPLGSKFELGKTYYLRYAGDGNLNGDYTKNTKFLFNGNPSNYTFEDFSNDFYITNQGYMITIEE